ncbi:LppA family lipoprotein [Nocardia sp. NPDC005978]|uniref:LppA family lipoprotein n=1 Tax=Nocardia sp. NPDC005978 TaxID=3156725 RepID=UPI0033A35374
MTVKRKRIRLHVAAAAVLLTMTGCDRAVSDPAEQTSRAESDNAERTLAGLPSLEESKAELEAAVLQLAAYIDTLVPGLRWEWKDSELGAECSPPFEKSQGVKLFLRHYTASGPVPDDLWPAVAQRAKELAAPLGSTEVETFPEQAGNHGVRYFGSNAPVLWARSGAATVITSNTGCRLPREVKDRD